MVECTLVRLSGLQIVLDLFTDSAGAGNLGCGAYFQGNGAIFPGHQLG